MWNEMIEHYIQNLVRDCKSCRASELPPPSRKVSISSLSNELNEVVCVDHFYLDELCLIHFMDMSTRFSTACIVENKSMPVAIRSFEESWVTHFWYPAKIRGDKALREGDFKIFMNNRDIEFNLVPKGRHSRNAIESKHAAIRNIFIRLQNDGSLDKETTAIKAVAISNDLYGSSVLSSFELAKGYSKPLNGNLKQVSDEVVKAYQDIQARRKLSRILKSKSNEEPTLKVGDMIEIFQHGKNNKRGQWSAPKKIIKIDHDGRNVQVPGRTGNTVCAAFEDVRLAIMHNDFAKLISDALDILDNEIEVDIDNISTEEDISDEDLDTNQPENIEEVDFTVNNDEITPIVGENIEVYWPLDDQYYPGTIGNIDEGKYTVNYDDGEVEILDMQEEIWKYQEGNGSTMATSNLRITSNEQDVLNSMQNIFGNKPFLKYQCQGFEMHPLYNAYKKEEEQFLNIGKVDPVESLPENANVVGSHTLYKLKSNDDKSLALKARIAPHSQNWNSQARSLRNTTNGKQNESYSQMVIISSSLRISELCGKMATSI